MKSECSEHQKRIPALFLGDLSETEKKDLETHLAACSQCRSEQDSYGRAMQQLTRGIDMDIPRHFFVYPEERASSPWQLFRSMRLGWQAAGGCFVLLMLLMGAAAFSRLQIQSGPAGWAIAFGHSDVDIAALKKDILDTAEKKNQESRLAWMQEVRNQIERSQTTLTKQQKLQLTAALALMDSRMNGRMTAAEGNVRNETHQLVSDLYRVIAQDRAQDLQAIKARLDRTDANNAIKTRQTNEILSTLLQVTDLELR